jgi:pyrroloquinoline quinone biosynthesis protein D
VSSLPIPRILELTPALSPMYRLQYEIAQRSWVLLYPEGMVRLNGPASEILRRCDGRRSVQQVVRELQDCFGEGDLRGDVCEFLSDAYERGWIR